MSTLRVTNIEDTAGLNSATTQQIYKGIAKAWVNFDGTGASATNQVINKAFNVSSVYKTGTGRFTAYFTTSFTDTNYVPMTSHVRTFTNNNNFVSYVSNVYLDRVDSVYLIGDTGSYIDRANSNVIVFSS